MVKLNRLNFFCGVQMALFIPYLFIYGVLVTAHDLMGSGAVPNSGLYFIYKIAFLIPGLNIAPLMYFIYDYGDVNVFSHLMALLCLYVTCELEFPEVITYVVTLGISVVFLMLPNCGNAWLVLMCFWCTTLIDLVYRQNPNSALKIVDASTGKVALANKVLKRNSIKWICVSLIPITIIASLFGSKKVIWDAIAQTDVLEK
ncbi:MAG: hypothetical protein R3Y63_13930 [Eubacteriales bacterium]